ncbi:type II toxin-antitoxin system RatA family toxin [Streptomyces adustus]
MRHVQLDAVVHDERRADVFERIVQWERYADLAPHVQSTTVHRGRPAPTGSSSWELHFRSGLLRWTETERFEPERGEVHFEQTDGDFDSFAGRWLLTERGDDVEVSFACAFDFGIPSLEGILDPIAERVIKETVAWALAGQFARVTLVGEPDPGDPGTSAAGLPATA